LSDPEAARVLLAEEHNLALRGSFARAMADGTWPKGLKRLWPIQYPELAKQSVVFVGINPSEGTVVPRVRDPRQLKDPRLAASVALRDRESFGLEVGIPCHRYFRLLDELSPPGWAHVDLFPVRERKQERLRAILSLGGDLHPIAKEWLALTMSFLIALKPRLVVVVNALAARLVEHHARAAWSLQFVEDGGWYAGTLPGVGVVPFLFSGMVTGQRALDRYSRDRLRWHISRALRVRDGERISGGVNRIANDCSPDPSS